MQKKLKIAIVTYTVSFGGVGTFILALAEKLKHKGNDVEIICTDKPGAWYSIIGEKEIRSYALNFGFLGFIPFGRTIQTFRVGKFLKKKKYDIILVNHSYFALSAIPMYREYSKIISIIHNQKTQVVKDDCINHKYLDKIACVSEKVRSEAIKFAPEEKVITVLNGIRIPSQKDLKERNKFNTPLKLLYVGRLDDHQKAIFLLPQIIKKINSKEKVVHLNIVGDGPDKEVLLRKIHELDLNNSITYLGLLSSDEVYRQYLSNHILLLPSNFEGLPLTLIEAMSCGCVPITTNLEGSTDLCVENGYNGFLVEKGDVSQIVKNTLELHSNPQKWQEMSLNSITKAQKEFSFEIMAEKYLNIMEDILNEKKRKEELRNIKISWKDIVPFHLIMSLKRFYRNVI